jgi:hypothetical protein
MYKAAMVCGSENAMHKPASSKGGSVTQSSKWICSLFGLYNIDFEINHHIMRIGTT